MCHVWTAITNTILQAFSDPLNNPKDDERIVKILNQPRKSSYKPNRIPNKPRESLTNPHPPNVSSPFFFLSLNPKTSKTSKSCPNDSEKPWKNPNDTQMIPLKK